MPWWELEDFDPASALWNWLMESGTEDHHFDPSASSPLGNLHLGSVPDSPGQVRELREEVFSQPNADA